MKPKTDVAPSKIEPVEVVAHDLFLNPVKAIDVVQFMGGKIYLAGIELTDTELWNIANEIEYLTKMRIWSIFQETLRNQAYAKVFCRVGTPNEQQETHGGKWMLYNLDEQLSIVKLLAQQATVRIPNGKPRTSKLV